MFWFSCEEVRFIRLLPIVLSQILNDVQDFLKVPRMDLHSRQVKIHKGPLSSQVENWSDVEKTLEGTSYQSFLHADYKI